MSHSFADFNAYTEEPKPMPQNMMLRLT